MDKKIYIMLPAYNEEENIGELIEKWEDEKDNLCKRGYEFEINVINDFSSDNTAEIVKQKMKKYVNLNIINHERNMGLCGGLNTGINQFVSRASCGDLLVFMDADNTHDPKYISEMIDKLNDRCNCVIASRYKKNSEIVGLAKNRETMSDLARLYYTLVLNIPNVKDYTCGYRVYTFSIIKNLVDKYGNSPIKEKSFACMMELLYKVYCVGGKFDELGFVLRYDNKKGSSKMKVIKTMKRSLITGLKLKKWDILIKVFIIFLAIFLSFPTNFSPLNNNRIIHDAGVFSYVGMAMRKGRMPYTGAWDNKGPLLYIIYAIGQSVADPFGIYLLEVLSLYIAILYTYKSIKLICNSKFLSISGTIFTFSVYCAAFFEGTLSEHFALPILTIQVYYMIKYIVNNFYLPKRSIICIGITVGIIALLRLNMLSIFAAMFLIIIFKLIKNKQYKSIGKWFMYGLTGIFIVVFPIFTYLAINGALFACIDSAYLSVMSGFENGGLISRIITTSQMLYSIDGTKAISLAVIITITSVMNYILNRKGISNKSKNLRAFAILAFLVNVYAVSLSGAFELHYCMTFVPIIAVFTAVLMKDVTELIITENGTLYKHLIVFICVYFLSFSAYNHHIQLIQILNKGSVGTLYDKIAEYILANTDENDYVQMIGGSEESASANYRSNRLAPTKYGYLPIGDSFKKERKVKIIQDFLKEFYTKDTKIIMICNKQKNEFYSLIEDREKWNEFLNLNYIENDNVIENYVVYNKR